MTKRAVVFIGTASALVCLAAPSEWAVSGHSCANVKILSEGPDSIAYHGSDNCQAVYAKGGTDDIHTGGGDDDIYGGDGDDYLEGEADHDMLYGNEGHDRLAGRAGNDHVQDSQSGGSDQDRLCSGYGIDYVDSRDDDHVDVRYMKPGDSGQENDGDGEFGDEYCPV